MVQTTEPRHRNHLDPWTRNSSGFASCRGLLLQPEMGSIVVVITNILSHEALEMPPIERDDMIEQISSAVANEALSYPILPRAAEAGPFWRDAEALDRIAQTIGGVQKPVIAAPSGTGFPVALLDPADQARIPLAVIKPELLHLSCHDDHDHDPLGLAVAVREQLREISHPSVGGQGSEPPVVYHDDMNDEPADSLTPKIISPNIHKYL